MAAKTPSQSKQETLDNIHMIVGQIAEAEDLSSMSLEDIDDKLGKNGISIKPTTNINIPIIK